MTRSRRTGAAAVLGSYDSGESNVTAMAGRRYEITDVMVETPRYNDGISGGMAVGPEDDLIGHGWIEIDEGSLVVAIRPDGIVGHLGPREKRCYDLGNIRGWRITGTLVEFSVGAIGGFATDGAEAPVHQGHFRLASEDDAQSLTHEAQAGGMNPPRQPPRHSGI